MAWPISISHAIYIVTCAKDWQAFNTERKRKNLTVFFGYAYGIAMMESQTTVPQSTVRLDMLDTLTLQALTGVSQSCLIPEAKLTSETQQK
jgi:hypothetical protein